MSVDATLEAIWADFRAARKEEDVDRMMVCQREFKLEYDPTVLGNHFIQKHAARLRVMESSIERAKRKTFHDTSEVSGSW
ncbi:MAG: hypothetical protein LPK02_07145 [Rhodobacterales bacterium]|nr:hypothetical protein [Rhodobacterales bacterium]